jgi:hypothetical protein
MAFSYLSELTLIVFAPLNRLLKNAPAYRQPGICGVRTGTGYFFADVLVMIWKKLPVPLFSPLIIVLARIYSDTSPPKKASFLPLLMFSFQRAWVSSRADPDLHQLSLLISTHRCIQISLVFSISNGIPS